MSNLLPANASPLELALMAFIERKLTALEIPIRRLWNPWECPLELLPWLAWTVSVDEWDTAWSEAQKRQTVADSFKIHGKKGTKLGVAQRLAALGYGVDITEWFSDRDNMLPYTFFVDVNTEDKPVNSTIFGTVKQLIDSAKNTRSHLTRLRLSVQNMLNINIAAGIYSGAFVAVGGPLENSIGAPGVAPVPPLPPWAPEGTIGIPITTARFEEYYSEGGNTVISGGVATVTRTEPASAFGATYSSLRALGSWDNVINGTLVVAYRLYNIDLAGTGVQTTLQTGGGRNGYEPFGEDAYAISFQTSIAAGTDVTVVSSGEVMDSTSLNLNIGFLFSKRFQNGQITFVGIVPFPTVGATIYSRNWADGLLTGQTLFGSNSPAQSVVSGRMRISSNALTDAKSRLTAIADLADFDLTFVAYPTTGGDVGVVYRTAYWGNANDTFAYYVGATTTDVSIGRGSNSISPAYTPLRSVLQTTASGTPVTIRLQVNGTLHKVWINGVLKMSVVDTTHTAAGGFGVRRYSATTSFGEIDDFVVKAIS